MNNMGIHNPIREYWDDYEVDIDTRMDGREVIRVHDYKQGDKEIAEIDLVDLVEYLRKNYKKVIYPKSGRPRNPVRGLSAALTRKEADNG
jgi:hypothetical protein